MPINFPACYFSLIPKWALSLHRNTCQDILFSKRPVNAYKFPRIPQRKQYLKNILFGEFNVSDYSQK